jgi:hypothetical protein
MQFEELHSIWNVAPEPYVESQIQAEGQSEVSVNLISKNPEKKLQHTWHGSPES